MKRQHKYRAKAVVCPETGAYFDSKGEYRRWQDLKLLERAGQITDLERQVKYPLSINGRPIKIRSKGYPAGRQCTLTLDYRYFEDGTLVVEDFKGYDTPASRLRRAVFEAQYGIPVRITGAAA